MVQEAHATLTSLKVTGNGKRRSKYEQKTVCHQHMTNKVEVHKHLTPPYYSRAVDKTQRRLGQRRKKDCCKFRPGLKREKSIP